MSLILEPYNIREARLHVRHLINICRCLDIFDAVNGLECASFSCLPNVINSSDDIKKILKSGELRINDADCVPPEYVLPGAKDIPFKPLIVLPPDSVNGLCAFKSVALSPFNPPSGPRKLKVLWIQT
jgi:protein TIF31